MVSPLVLKSCFIFHAQEILQYKKGAQGHPDVLWTALPETGRTADPINMTTFCDVASCESVVLTHTHPPRGVF